MEHFCISTIPQNESQGLPKDKSWTFMDFPWFSINLEVSDRDDFYINSIKSQGLSGNPKSSQNLKRERESMQLKPIIIFERNKGRIAGGKWDSQPASLSQI